jgi:hypothetical protein
VILVSPAPSAVVDSSEVRFVWAQGRPQVSRYWFEVSSDSLFTTSERDTSVVDTTKVVGGLGTSPAYWWRVKARNATGWGAFSEVRKFRVDLTSVRGIDVEKPTTYVLDQNYPNPFNPSTTIRYGLPERSHVTISVYNTLGQQVAQLVNNAFEAGYYDVNFDASSLPTGVYFYRMQAGRFVETRKLLLVR